MKTSTFCARIAYQRKYWMKFLECIEKMVDDYDERDAWDKKYEG